jgi:adenine-specific DNA methylase
VAFRGQELLHESDFPAKEVSQESVREKNIRNGHIATSTLHIWWARKPLTSSRASIYTALAPEPNESIPPVLEEVNDKARIEEPH